MKVLFYLGIPAVMRAFIQKNKVTIILLHDINLKNAGTIFQWLSQKYNIISLNTYINAVLEKDWSKIPDRALVITLDDGNVDNYKLLPLLKKNRIPLTIFLCAGIVNTNRHFWFKFKGLDIPTDELKVISNQERLEFLTTRGYQQDKEFSYPQAMNKEQIKEMREFVNFQSHTLFHPILPKCSDEECRDEIFLSKEILEKEFDLKINAIAFPNGDYTEREIEFIKEAGYSCSLTVDFGFNSLKTSLYHLRRLSVSDDDSLEMLALKTSGFWQLFKNIFNIKSESMNYSGSAENESLTHTYAS